MEKIAVIGAGGWGTTLSLVLAKNGNPVNIWAREKEIAESINKEHENKLFLKGVKLPDIVCASTDLKEVLMGKEIVITAVPSQFLRATAKEIAKYIKSNAIVVNVSKGLEIGTHRRMTEILKEELPAGVRLVALSGPNHAEEVSRNLPTATVIASKDAKALQKIKSVFDSSNFKVYMHEDIIGVEICGAIKNITAIACGVVDRLKLGDNAKASIITLGLTEMNNFGRHFGAKKKTVYGLAGVGDLIATCTSRHSRNRFVGDMLAQGKNFDEIREAMHCQIAEGISTTKAVYEFSNDNGIGVPLTEQVYKVIYEKKELKEAIKDLIMLI